jgi:hypothetical protein
VKNLPEFVNEREASYNILTFGFTSDWWYCFLIYYHHLFFVPKILRRSTISKASLEIPVTGKIWQKKNGKPVLSEREN